jgi:hypothetical protein
LRLLAHSAVAAVIVAMFHIVESAMQTAIVSLVVLIYATVTGSFSAVLQALFRKWDQDLATFIGRTKLLHRSDMRNYEAIRKDYQRTLERMRTAHRIDTGFNILFVTIALGNLVHAVVA